MSINPAIQGLRGGQMSIEILPGPESHSHTARIIGKCVVTGSLHAVECDAVKLLEYQLQIAEDREPLIQKVFPDMDAADREFLISGISPEGWKRMYR